MTKALKAKELQRLLNNTPSPAHADATGRLAGFIEVIEPFDLRHVQMAVTMILNGSAPGVDAKFAIYPPMIAQICRQLRDREIDRTQLHKGAVLQIMDRGKEFHQQPAEVRRAAVTAGLARLTAGVEPELSPQQRSAQRQALEERMARHDKHFLGDDTDEAKKRRLVDNRR